MSATPAPSDSELKTIIKQIPEAENLSTESLDAKNEGFSEKLMDQIEMIGEETAANLPSQPDQISAGMRYLHCSRTIHQLVTDRNRAVGIYLGSATLLMTASSMILNAKASGDMIIPLEQIHKWCLPVTFGVLTVLAVLMDMLLVRTRVGLIYEVAKMNALLGLPVGRVSRLSPLSIFFILQMIIALAGGLTGGFFAAHMWKLVFPETSVLPLVTIFFGLLVTAGLMAIFILTVKATTSDERLQALGHSDHTPKKK